MGRIWNAMKTFLTLSVRSTSVLATQKYRKEIQKNKPENQSVLGAYIYGSKKNTVTEGKKNDTEIANKNK